MKIILFSHLGVGFLTENYKNYSTIELLMNFMQTPFLPHRAFFFFSFLFFSSCAHVIEMPVGWIPKEKESSKLLKQLSSDRPVQIFFPAGVYGPQNSGLSFDFPIPAGHRYELQYDILFAEDFEFVKGGKLPGLCGGMYKKVSSAANHSVEQWEFEEGFSLRTEWRERGKLVGFLFHPFQETSEGEDISFRWKGNDLSAPRGKWFRITMRAFLNTPSKSDGQVEYRIDDLVVANAASLKVRADRNAMIDRLCFSNFFEGTAPSWAPKRDLRLWIKNLKLQAL